MYMFLNEVKFNLRMWIMQFTRVAKRPVFYTNRRLVNDKRIFNFIFAVVYIWRTSYFTKIQNLQE